MREIAVSRIRHLLVLLLVLAAAAIMLRAPTPAFGASFTVDSLGDESDASPGDGVCATALATCTLRAAAEEASLAGESGTIDFSVSGEIELTGSIGVFADAGFLIEIEGPGSEELTVAGDGVNAVFTLRRTSLSGLTVTGGGDSGIQVEGSFADPAVEFSDLVVIGNTSPNGGGGSSSIRPGKSRSRIASYSRTPRREEL